MPETLVNIDERVAGLKFDQSALEASFAQMGKTVEPEFVDAMRRTMGQYATAYREDLAAHGLHRVSTEAIKRQPASLDRTLLLVKKQLAETNRQNVAATRRAFELLGQGSAVFDVEVAVASNYIMQDLGKK